MTRTAREAKFAQNLRCACLGTAVNLPVTTVTLVEDISMTAMATVMLVAR